MVSVISGQVVISLAQFFNPQFPNLFFIFLRDCIKTYHSLAEGLVINYEIILTTMFTMIYTKVTRFINYSSY